MQTTTSVESGTGLVLDLVHPEMSQMSLTDVVHALAFTPKFLGAVNQPYSVGQHILLMFELLDATRRPDAKRMALMYFITHAHVPYTGDIPPQLTRMLDLRDRLPRIFARIHSCFAKHLISVYALDPTIHQAFNVEDAKVVTKLSLVTKAYEAFHLLTSGGWTMTRDASGMMVDVASELWKSARYVFTLDKPPDVLDPKVVHAKLLKTVDELCRALAVKEVSNESAGKTRENATA